MARQQKPFAFFDNLDTFKSMKISGDETNTQYIDFSGGPDQLGTPDIMFETICVIDQEKLIFTHGKFYGDSRIPWHSL